jgi:predicted PolB exonuclease-like 3'-5' exonuclease
MSPVLAFDIETIPDIAGLRLLRGAEPALSDAEVHAAEIADRAARNKSDFLPPHLQRVLVVSCVFRGSQGLVVRSFVDLERDGRSEEGDVIQAFFDRVEKYKPQLVSWNGGGFDLPVLQQRGMRHGVVAGRYWDMGQDDDSDREHRYNNYISRYHLRHVDLMDLLALYQSKANAPLDAMAKLCGFPGKLGMDGSQVYAAYLEGRRDEIRRYCETDVMNTYLLWLRFEKMRARLDETSYLREVALARATVGATDEPHWAEYLAAWPEETESRRTSHGRGRAIVEKASADDATPPDDVPPLDEAAAAEATGETPAPAEPATIAVVETTTTTTETTVYIDSPSIRA